MLKHILNSLSIAERKLVELHVAEGLALSKAFVLAFPHTAAQMSSKTRGQMCSRMANRLIRDERLQMYVAYLQKESIESGKRSRMLTFEEKREFLARAVRSTPDSVDEHSDLVNEVRAGPTGLTYKVVDKLRALELDAKLAGELREAVDVSVNAKVLTALGELL